MLLFLIGEKFLSGKSGLNIKFFIKELYRKINFLKINSKVFIIKKKHVHNKLFITIIFLLSILLELRTKCLKDITDDTTDLFL